MNRNTAMSKNEFLDDLTFIEVFDPVYKYQIKNTVGDVSSTTTVSVPSDEVDAIVNQIKSIPVQLKL